MATNKTTLFNEALSIAGSRHSISLPEENSREAEVCRLWYPAVRDMVQRAAPWPSNKAYRRLALLSSNEGEMWDDTMPEPGFRFAYSAPENMLYPRNLTSFLRFTLTVNESGTQIINTNQEQAILSYSFTNDNIPSWDIALRIAVSNMLGAAICMPLTGRRGVAAEAVAQANSKVAEARQLIQNVGQDQYEYIPDWLVARGYSGGMTQTRYAYPFGPQLTLGMLGNAT